VETRKRNLNRITVEPGQMGGAPRVRHLRIPVETLLRLLAGGKTEKEILAEYPDLEAEDIRECLRFAATSAMEREMPSRIPLEVSGRQCIAPTSGGTSRASGMCAVHVRSYL